jgi:hypothetical protein
MKTAMGLIGLGVLGGTIPTGLAGIAHAGAVVGGTAAALALLVGVCLGRAGARAPQAQPDDADGSPISSERVCHPLARPRHLTLSSSPLSPASRHP